MPVMLWTRSADRNGALANSKARVPHRGGGGSFLARINRPAGQQYFLGRWRDSPDTHGRSQTIVPPQTRRRGYPLRWPGLFPQTNWLAEPQYF